MKKVLLSMAAVAMAASLSAAEYTIFDYEASDKAAWAENAATNGFKSEVTVDGKSFTITTDKAGSTTPLRNPGTEDYEWRVYKNSSFTIESSDVTMKTIIITFAGMVGDKNYTNELTLSTGWIGTLTGDDYRLVNEAGSNTFTGTSAISQTRIKKVVVSDEVIDGPGNGGGDEPGVDLPVVKSIAEVKALASETKVKVDFPMTVAFVSYKNVFVTDGTDFIQIYGTNEYEKYDVVPAGWEATYEFYNDVTPELMPVGTLPAASARGEFTPAVVAAKDITTAMVNSVIMVNGVELSEASPASKDNFTGVSDGVTLNLRNNYELESVEAGTYNIELLVQVYQGEPSLYVIKYNEPSAVAEIAAENGEAVYYNLQGAKVTNPENGLYIKVQNGKATKVILNK